VTLDTEKSELNVEIIMLKQKFLTNYFLCACLALSVLALQALGDDEQSADISKPAENEPGYVREQDGSEHAKDVFPADPKARGVRIGASLKLGTTGPGADITIGFNNKLSLRAGYNYFSKKYRYGGETVTETVTVGGKYEFQVEYEEDDEELLFKLETAPVLLDWHPFSGSFRLSIGAFYNNNHLALTVWPADSYGFNDVDYHVERYDQKIAFEPISPYVGLGFGNAANRRRRLAFAFDLGVIYHGAPQVTMQAIASNPAQQSALDRDVDAEVADIEDSMKSFKIYPVITLGLSYRF
jgi:hypothetical protein